MYLHHEFLCSKEASDEKVLRTAADEKLAMRPVSLQ
jgi:hypothetical protein